MARDVKRPASLGAPRARKKYWPTPNDPIDDAADDLLSSRAGRSLVRLVKKHGKQLILDAVQKVGDITPRRQGRPSRGLSPSYEAMSMAQTFDELATEHYEQGSQHPMLDAEKELYELGTGRKGEPGDRLFDTWRETKKKQRLMGRTLLRQLVCDLEKLERRFKRRGRTGLPSHLKQRLVALRNYMRLVGKIGKKKAQKRVI